MARVLGKHFVVRGMHDAAELQAIAEGLDSLSVEERSELYNERKRHKEAVVFLHELGHLFAALHANDQRWIMHASYHHDMQAFAPENRSLMRIAFLGRAEAAQPAVVAQRLLMRLKEDGPVWSPQAKAELIGALEQAGASDTGGASAETSSEAVEVTRTEEDVSTLSEADRARLRAIDATLQSGDANGAWAEAHSLAERYADVYAVQHRACQIAMQMGVAAAQGRDACQRMVELSTQVGRDENP
jgi:hypothetical protein